MIVRAEPATALPTNMTGTFRSSSWGKASSLGLYPELCGPEDIAPTLAKMLGFPYPCEEDSRLLLEMTR